MNWYRRFMRKNGLVGLFMSIYAVVYVLMIVMFGVLDTASYNAFVYNVSLPVDVPSLAKAPWTILTYWMVSQPFWIWLLIVDMMLIYTFGNILNAMVGDRRTQGILFFSIVVNAILTVTLVNILPTVESSIDAPIFGLHTINATLITAAITLVPNYEIRIIRWRTKLLYVGAVMLFIMAVSYQLIWTTMGTSVLVGMIVGFTWIKILQRGTDLTSWFQFDIGFATHHPRPVDPMVRSRIKVVQTSSRMRQESGPKSAPKMTDADRLDQLLDKINEIGYQNLTRKEKEELDRLSNDN